MFGVEGDFDWDNIKGNPSACVGCQVSSTWLAGRREPLGPHASSAPAAGRSRAAAWGWHGTGFCSYGTVGAAFQNVKFAVTAPPLTTPLATTVDPVGVIAGGRVEFAILPNWSVKAEYLYVSFNNQMIGPGTFTLIENVVRGGVNYRF